MPDWTKEEQKAHRVELVAALRSGKYKQAQGALKRGNHYCCLGVACKVSKIGVYRRGSIYNPSFWVLKKYLPDGTDCERSDTSMPTAVMDYFGFANRNGAYIDPKTKNGTSLIALNDDLYKDFNFIADVIEAEPEGLLSDEAK